MKTQWMAATILPKALYAAIHYLYNWQVVRNAEGQLFEYHDVVPPMYIFVPVKG